VTELFTFFIILFAVYCFFILYVAAYMANKVVYNVIMLCCLVHICR